MAWVRIDDHLHAHPKFRLAWELEPASIGLELFALTHSAANLTDGAIDDRFDMRLWFRHVKRRDRAIAALVHAGLWVPNGTSWQIHDYLDYNEPRDALLARRRVREAKRRHNRARSE